MVKTVNFRIGRGRVTERRKAFSARGLLAAMNVVGMTDDEQRAVLSRYAAAVGAQLDHRAKEGRSDE